MKKYITSSINDKHSSAEDFVDFVKAFPEAGFIEFQGNMRYYLFAVEETAEDPDYMNPEEYEIDEDLIQSVEKGKVFSVSGTETYLELETDEGVWIFP